MTFRLLAPDDPALQALEETLADSPPWNITLDIIPWADYRDRLMDTLQADRGDYHAVCTPGHVWLPELAAAGLLLPLDALVEASPEALAAYGPDDLLPTVAQESRYRGAWYQFPLFSDGHLLFYRADLIDLPAGDPVPTVSTAALADLAASVHQPPDVYGVALKAHPSEIFLDWLPFLWEAGGDVLGADEQPAFNTAAGIIALERYCALRAFCPPDTHTYGNAEIAAAIRAGRVALATTWGGQAAPIFLADGARAATRYRAAVFPRPWNATWGIAVPANMPPADQVATVNLLLALATARQDRRVIQVAGSPVRRSSYSPDALVQYPWLAAQQVMLARAGLLPIRPETGQFLGALYGAVYDAFTGQKSPAQALGEAAATVRQVLSQQR